MTAESRNNDRPLNPSADEPAVSKSQLKRDAQVLRSLAKQLNELPPSQLLKVPLEEDVLRAVEQARNMRSHGAKRRQLQYVAKLLRRGDATPVFEAVESFKTEARGLTAQQHRIEAWRDLLLDQGDAALGELLKERPGMDIQALRQLIRNGQHERSAGKPPAAARSLFRTLREMDQKAALPPCP